MVCQHIDRAARLIAEVCVGPGNTKRNSDKELFGFFLDERTVPSAASFDMSAHLGDVALYKVNPQSML